MSFRLGSVLLVWLSKIKDWTLFLFAQKERNTFIGWDWFNTIYISYLQVRFTIAFNCNGTIAYISISADKAFVCPQKQTKKACQKLNYKLNFDVSLFIQKANSKPNWSSDQYLKRIWHMPLFVSRFDDEYFLMICLVAQSNMWIKDE